MSAVFGERVKLGQANGSEIELVVFGDENYARYETLEGFAVVYDKDLGLFCHARLIDGRSASTGVAADQPPPAGAHRHEQESPAVRRESAAARQAARDRPAGR